jgi:hypothetical protein
VEQVVDARQLLKLFDICDEAIVQSCASEKVSVRREVVIDGGRLDVVIDLGNDPFLLIECKTKWFDRDAVRGQLNHYARWANRYQTLTRRFFVAVEAGDFVCPDKFEFLPWRQISLRVRAQIREWLQSYQNHGPSDRSLILCAMASAFCGAVEQNLLALSAKPHIFMARTTAEYLREWLSGNGGRTDGPGR